MKILVLNAGSSSLKSALYDLAVQVLPDQPPAPLWAAQIDWIEPEQALLKVTTATGKALKQTIPSQGRSQDMLRMLQTLWAGDTQMIADPSAIEIVGHRVVHGGQDYQQSTLVTEAVKAAIARLALFAPVHNPVNLAGIEAIEEILGDVPQVAVFDTAFHAQLPPAAYVYPGSYEWLEQGIRRYGFHGISHQYCAQRAAQLLQRPLPDLRLITCHLGNGCSLAAIRDGHSVDTTMGFTPLDGLMMGTRSGAVDPGILIHLLRQSHYTADDLDALLNRHSGLLGISGVSNDLRQLTAAIAQGNDRAQLALDIYIHRLRAAIAAMLPSLERLDALIFTAGVGENAASIRAATCEGLAFLGLKIDAEKNAASPVDQDIATMDSTVRILVIRTQEDWAIAQECWRLGHKDR